MTKSSLAFTKCITKIRGYMSLSSGIRTIHRYSFVWLVVASFPLFSYANFMEIQLGLNDYLSTKFNSEFEEIDSLKITGYFHTNDINFIRENLSGTVTSTSTQYKYKKGHLCYLDLSEAVFADRFNEFNGTIEPKDRLPESFGNWLAVSTLKLPKIIIGSESFCDNPFLTTIEIAQGTQIGMYCFRNCDALKSVYIPKDCQFSNTCFRAKNLQSYNVDSSNPYYKSVNGLLLDKDGKILLAVPYGLKRIKVPDSVESVNWAAFERNPNIEIIQFGTNFTTFDVDPFDDNPCLDRIIIQSLSPINLPKSNGQYYYFSGCDHFKRCGYLYVPAGTKQYYEGALGWEEVPNIIEYVHDDLEQIFEREIDDDPYGYEYDFKIDDIYYKVTSFEDNTVGVVNGFTPYTGSICIPNEITYKNRKLRVTSIISMNNGDISYLSIPNSVTSIGGLSDNSFEAITLPNTLVELKDRVFAHCESLKYIDIPEGVEGIPSSAFAGCYKLEKVNWRPSKSVSDIGPRAFFDCFSLKTFTFTSNMYATGTISTSGLVYVSSFYNCTSLDSISFEDDSSIYFGYYHDGIERDKDCGEFYGSNVRKIYLGSLYRNHFFSPGPHFDNLEDLVIGDNIEKIKRESNYSTYPPLHGLKNLTIGRRISEIESFSSENIWVRNPVPPNINGTLSNDVYLNSKLYVPKGTIESYQNAPVWKNFWNIEEYDCDVSSVSKIEADVNKYPIGIYDLNGIKHDDLTKGLNIIRYSDGTVEKIFN